MSTPSGPSYPPYFSGPTEKWPNVPTPRRERTVLKIWSVVTVLLFVAAMIWLVSALV